ncbi:MAG: helix-turn-helix domain-containing protein [Alistipes sp.]|nr:helix-turn-helix domain-containing protein [Alistipes sp.]
METKDILKMLRKNRNQSAKDVAVGCDMSLGVYQKYESGERGVGTPALCKLADFYGVTTDYLLGREPLPNPFAELNLSNDDETAVMEKFMSLPDSFRACALELLRELGGAVKGNDESVQPNSQSDPEQVQRSDTYTCGELEEIQKQNDFNKDAG